jgi:hypothetical protein
MTATQTNQETAIEQYEPQQLTPMQSADMQTLMDPRSFEHIQRVAKVYAASKMVPQQYQGNAADCIIALQMSMRLGCDPFMFMQSSYVVSGRPGMEAKLAIALVNQRGPFRGPIRYEMHRDANGVATGCTAWATHKSGEKCDATVDWDLVKAEGWDRRNGSKWKTMPEQMFKYRAAVFLIRSYCPEVILGMHTTDELQDVYGDTRYVESQAGPPRPSLADKLQQDDEPSPAWQQHDDANTDTDAAGESDTPEAAQDEDAGQDEPAAASGGEGSSAAPEPWDLAIERLMVQSECTYDAAAERLEKWSQKFHAQPFAESTPDQLKNARTLIDQGAITVKS